MEQWLRSIGWDQWLRLAEMLVYAALIGYLRRKGCEANLRDEEGRNVEG